MNRAFSILNQVWVHKIVWISLGFKFQAANIWENPAAKMENWSCAYSLSFEMSLWNQQVEVETLILSGASWAQTKPLGFRQVEVEPGKWTRRAPVVGSK